MVHHLYYWFVSVKGEQEWIAGSIKTAGKTFSKYAQHILKMAPLAIPSPVSSAERACKSLRAWMSRLVIAASAASMRTSAEGSTMAARACPVLWIMTTTIQRCPISKLSEWMDAISYSLQNSWLDVINDFSPFFMSISFQPLLWCINTLCRYLCLYNIFPQSFRK